MHPSRGVDGLAGGLLVVPVAEHHVVTPGAVLPRRAPGNDRARLRVDDLDLDVRVDPTDGGDPPLQRILARRLHGDGRGLGHPVADRDLGDVHQRLHLPHHLDRTRRARHHAGAQRRQVELGEARVAELGDEHAGNAVERRAAFGAHRFQGEEGIERLARGHDASTVGGAGEVADHHPEAVVEGHGNAHAVVLGVAHGLGQEVTVVQDVVMGEGRALGSAGGARGVLDVDGIVELEEALALRERLRADTLATGPKRIPLVLEDHGYA